MNPRIDKPHIYYRDGRWKYRLPPFPLTFVAHWELVWFVGILNSPNFLRELYA